MQKFDEWADVMASKEKPKRVKILGCNGKKYGFSNIVSIVFCCTVMCSHSNIVTSCGCRYYFLVKAEKTGDLRKDMYVTAWHYHKRSY